MKLLRIATTFAPADGNVYSFISPVNYFKLTSADLRCAFFCDGMLAAWLFSRLLRTPVPRMSFDLGSVAAGFLDDQAKRGRSVLFIGGKPEQSAPFLANLKARYPGLHAACIDGYPASGFHDEAVMRDLLAAASRHATVVVSLGAPLQERVALALHERGYQGTLLTAGAFVSQTAAGQDGNYYPAWINRLHLRFLWRLIKEPHTRARFPLVLMFPFVLGIDLIRARTRLALADR